MTQQLSEEFCGPVYSNNTALGSSVSAAIVSATAAAANGSYNGTFTATAGAPFATFTGGASGFQRAVKGLPNYAFLALTMILGGVVIVL